MGMITISLPSKPDHCPVVGVVNDLPSPRDRFSLAAHKTSTLVAEQSQPWLVLLSIVNLLHTLGQVPEAFHFGSAQNVFGLRI